MIDIKYQTVEDGAKRRPLLLSERLYNELCGYKKI